MTSYTSTQREYQKVATFFLWSEATDFTAWFTGEWKRWKRTEYNLPRLVQKRALKAVRYGHKLVYTVPGNKTADIEHGLICTKSLLRFKLSKEGQFISESFFRKTSFGSVPEWAVIYGPKMLLFEYSTADNFRRTRLMKRKLNQYRQSVADIEVVFQATAVVLFVFDTTKHEVIHFVKKYGRDQRFYFTDLISFMNVSMRKQLTAPIYIWGGDGKSYPLINDD